MTLQMLQYFLAIAKTGSFTRAADECFVTQPTLSRAIRELEDELGCELLRRTSRSVELTEAGIVCVEEAGRVMSDVKRLAQKVRAAADVQETPLKVGYIIYDHLMTFVRSLADPDDGRLPVTLDSKYADCETTKQRFLSGELDMIVLPEPSVADIDDCERHCLVRSKAYVILYKDNPLFDRESVRLSELKNMSVIAWDDKDVPLLNAAFRDMFLKAGIRPRIVGTAEKMGDMFTQIMLCKAIGFGTGAAVTRSAENVRYVLIEDSPECFGTVCLWHKDNASDQIRRIRECYGLV